MADERLDKNGVEVEVGHRVMIKKISAVVRFVGTATFKPGLWVGLEADDAANGMNDGSLKGQRYFTCKKDGKPGLFARPRMLTIIGREEDGEGGDGGAATAAATPAPAATATASSTPADVAATSSTTASGRATPTGTSAASATTPSVAPTETSTAASQGSSVVIATRVVKPTHKSVVGYVEQEAGKGEREISFSKFVSKARISGMPPALFGFPQFKSVDLTNHMVAEIPAEAAGLAKIRILKLTNNAFTELPDTIAAMPTLQSLVIDQNALVAVSPAIGELVNLKILSLASNRLTSLPDELGNCVAMVKLDISQNQLTAVPTTLDNLVNLKAIDISGNGIKALPRGMMGRRKSGELKIRNARMDASASVSSVGGASVSSAGESAPGSPMTREEKIARKKRLLAERAAKNSADAAAAGGGSTANGGSGGASVAASPAVSAGEIEPVAPREDGNYSVDEMRRLTMIWAQEVAAMQAELDPMAEQLRADQKAAAMQVAADDFEDDKLAAEEVEARVDIDAMDAAAPAAGGAHQSDDSDDGKPHGKGEADSSDDGDDGDGGGGGDGEEEEEISPEEQDRRDRIRKKLNRRERDFEKVARSRHRNARIQYRLAERQKIMHAKQTNTTYIPGPPPDYGAVMVAKDPQELVPIDKLGDEDLVDVNLAPENEVISLNDRSAQGDRIKVKSNFQRRLERFYTFEWSRRANPAMPWRKIAWATRAYFIPSFIDVGGDLMVVGTPRVPEMDELLFRVHAVEPSFPYYKDISLDGPEYHNTHFTINGKYYGGVEGPSEVTWYKTYNGEDYLPLKGVDPDGRGYQATSDDVSAQIRVEYVPIRADGERGSVVFAQTSQLIIAPRTVSIVKQYLGQEKCKFDVVAQGKEHDNVDATLQIKKKKISLVANNGGITIYKMKLSGDVKVYLHPIRKEMLKLQLAQGVSIVLHCADSEYRDVVALSVSFFSKKARKEDGR